MSLASLAYTGVSTAPSTPRGRQGTSAGGGDERRRRMLHSGNESQLGGDMSSSPVMPAAHHNDNALSPLANVTNSPVAIVTSTRPVSSQIICPPTPQLVQFDKALDLESEDQV